MIRKLITKKEEGFTLIELMIVIAIIGVLAAIAIPNFIAYRNKSYCTMVSGDAQALKGAIGAYFSNPTKTTVNGMGPTDFTPDVVLSGSTAAIAQAGEQVTITLTPTGNATKCQLGSTFVAYLGTTTQGGWQP